MTNDDFLDALKADWRRQDVDLERIRALTERRLAAARLSLGARLGGTMLAVLFGGWFAWRAIAGSNALDAVGAVAMAVAVPLMLIEYATARRLMRSSHTDTPAGLIAHARDQADGMRRLLAGCRLTAAILAACAAAALLLAAAGLADARVVLFVATVWGASALGVWLWQSMRERRLAAEIARCDEWLAQFGEAETP